MAKSWIVRHVCGHRYRWTSLVPDVKSVRKELEPMIDAALTKTRCPACGGDTGVFHPEGKVTFHHRGVPVIEGEPMDAGSRLILPPGARRDIGEAGEGSNPLGVQIERG